jgi:uncharacterized protein (DUF2126 family)
MEVTKMPYGDRTGPRGMGPVTGRGFGFCTGYSQPGRYTTPGGWYHRGGGSWYGGGGGWGHRNWYRATGLTGWQRAAWFAGRPDFEAGAVPVSSEDEAVFLRREAEDLERALGEVKRRLEEMEKNKE